MQTSMINIDHSFNSLQTFPVIETESYIIRLAFNQKELESIFRLRFQVFNLELGLGYLTSNLTQMDQDEFDAVWHHLILIYKETGQIVGSYRMQTYSMASQTLGFYAAQYFNLTKINDSLLQVTVEIGRACIAKEYRTIQALSLLFKGLANYLAWSGNQYFLGCATLPTQSHYKACCAYNYFQNNGFMHPSILVEPKSQYSLELSQDYPDSCNVEIPDILQLYLASGAKICSFPSIDRQFKCIDFLTMFDGANFSRW
ncbi:GNAT family N-acetyltransferase [Halotia branconii]|uniref:GNAT family N-acyltransferase n=1 Tax=Halotia branconii CENA392 TaxID=1539056 RepID=A0AAJ6P8Q6_9CYAN|nr:GNAT family N-acyltransferase [Halotia branconii]WGV25034.1 GNAT family N-acyltransferase [Halotia branconii CENA392]